MVCVELGGPANAKSHAHCKCAARTHHAKCRFSTRVSSRENPSRACLRASSLLALSCVSASAQQVTGVPGSPGATTTIDGKQLPPPDPKFGGVIKEKASESTGLVGAARRAAEGRAQRAAHHDGRRQASARQARSAASYRRRPWIASPRRGCATRISTPRRSARRRGRRSSPGRNHHVGRLRVVGEIATGFPGYDSIIPIEKGTIGTILKENGYATSWFGKDHNTPFVSVEPGRAVRSMAERHGLRVLLWLRRRRRQPVAAEPVPQYDGHLSLPGQSRLEPDDGDGRRGHPAHEAAQGDRARQAVLCLLRAGRHPRARIIRRRSGSRRSATCTCSTTAGTSCARPSSPTRSGWASCPRTPS